MKEQYAFKSQGSRLGTEAEHSGALDGKNDTPTVDSKSGEHLFGTKWYADKLN